MISPDIKIRLCNHRKKTMAWSRGVPVKWRDDLDWKTPKGTNWEAINTYIALIHQTLEEAWNNKYHYYNRAKDL